jgi:hypothetical protein
LGKLAGKLGKLPRKLGKPHKPSLPLRWKFGKQVVKLPGSGGEVTKLPSEFAVIFPLLNSSAVASCLPAPLPEDARAMSNRLLAGKWLGDAVPKLGWSCVGMVDLRAREPQAPTEICQMCEARHIRYVHILQHGAWPEPLRAGFTCAERMEGNRGEARRRERQVRAAAKRLEKWVSTGWTTVSNERGVTVTQRDCGDWRIEVVSCGKYCLLHLRHLARDRVVTTNRAQSLILAKYDGWDLWHEGEAIRTAYLEELAKERTLQREREEEARREEEAERRAEWQRGHPDWDVNERAWSDWLDWHDQDAQFDWDRERALSPWTLSKKNGNPWFAAQGHVFIALSPQAEDPRLVWRLWAKKPGAERGRVVPRWQFPSFEALQQVVERLLANSQAKAKAAHFGAGPSPDAALPRITA